MRHPDRLGGFRGVVPRSQHGAAARRDSKLLRVRKLTLWVTGGAAAASLGLGSVFAHALPGHSHSTASSAGAQATTTAPARAAAGQRQGAAGRAGALSGQAPARHRGTGHGLLGHGPARQQHGRKTGLTPPEQQPRPATPAPAPPPVSSGGS
jgi:hypothetical protein